MGRLWRGLGRMVNRRWHLGLREERMQLLLGLAGITHAAFLDTRTVGCGLRPAGRVRAGVPIWL